MNAIETNASPSAPGARMSPYSIAIQILGSTQELAALDRALAWCDAAWLEGLDDPHWLEVRHLLTGAYMALALKR